MVSCKISPVIAAVHAQLMCRQAQAGAQTCLDPISNWMVLQEAAASAAMLTNSPSTVGDQDWRYERRSHKCCSRLCERRGLSKEFGNPRLVGKAWQGYVDY